MPSPAWPHPIYLDSWTQHSRFLCNMILYSIRLSSDFIASDFTFTTRHVYNWALFPLWPSLFILSEAISPLFPSSILDTYSLGDSSGIISFLPFHTVHGVLKARILERFATPFSSGPCFVRTLHQCAFIKKWKVKSVCSGLEWWPFNIMCLKVVELFNNRV